MPLLPQPSPWAPSHIEMVNKSDAMLGVAREQCANTLYTYSVATNFSNVLYYGGVVLQVIQVANFFKWTIKIMYFKWWFQHFPPNCSKTEVNIFLCTEVNWTFQCEVMDKITSAKITSAVIRKNFCAEIDCDKQTYYGLKSFYVIIIVYLNTANTLICI